MREDGSDSKAARALDVHEIRVWRLHKSLELVLLLLELGRGVEEIDGESHFVLRGFTDDEGPFWF